MKNYEKLRGMQVSASSLIDILKNSDYQLEAPINIDKIIDILEIPVNKKPNFRKSKITGIISMKNGSPEIWINPMMNQNKERERFTLAHELGHFMLHIAPSFEDYDREDKDIEFNRDSNWDIQEMEANRFAAELLMPTEFIKQEVKNLDPAENKENKLERLATTFNVSKQAIKYRLQSMRIEL